MSYLSFVSKPRTWQPWSISRPKPRLTHLSYMVGLVCELGQKGTTGSVIRCDARRLRSSRPLPALPRRSTCSCAGCAHRPFQRGQVEPAEPAHAGCQRRAGVRQARYHAADQSLPRGGAHSTSTSRLRAYTIRCRV